MMTHFVFQSIGDSFNLLPTTYHVAAQACPVILNSGWFGVETRFVSPVRLLEEAEGSGRASFLLCEIPSSRRIGVSKIL